MTGRNDDELPAELLRVREIRDGLARLARDAADEAMGRAEEEREAAQSRGEVAPPAPLPPGQEYEVYRHETIYDALGIEPAAPRRRGRGRPPLGARERGRYLAARDRLERAGRKPTEAALAEELGIEPRQLRRWNARLNLPQTE